MGDTKERETIWINIPNIVKQQQQQQQVKVKLGLVTTVNWIMLLNDDRICLCRFNMISNTIEFGRSLVSTGFKVISYTYRILMHTEHRHNNTTTQCCECVIDGLKHGGQFGMPTDKRMEKLNGFCLLRYTQSERSG